MKTYTVSNLSWYEPQVRPLAEAIAQVGDLFLFLNLLYSVLLPLFWHCIMFLETCPSFIDLYNVMFFIRYVRLLRAGLYKAKKAIFNQKLVLSECSLLLYNV